MRIVLDIDGVLAQEGDVPVYGPLGGWDYSKCVPVAGAVEATVWLKEQGHEITLSSSRWLADYQMTVSWLNEHGFQFDALILGRKPSGDLYVDDRGLRFESWDQTIEFIKGLEGFAYAE